jgi:hypothetical protein
MTKRLAAIGVLALTGCVMSHPSRADRLRRTYDAHHARCPEIMGALSMDHDSNRRDALERIARRPDLTPHEQIHLLDATIDSFSSDRYRRPVLVALASNPAIAPEARWHVAQRMSDLDFDSTRRDVQLTLEANPPRAVAGVSSEAVTDDGWVHAFGMQVASAGELIVAKVSSGWPAAKAGLQAGDRIVRVNDRDVVDFAAFRRELASPTERVTLTVLRRDQRIVIQVR